MEGRFGAYVTDGTTNATLPKSLAPEQLTLEEAAQLIDERAAKGPPAKKGRGRKAPAKEERIEMMLAALLALAAAAQEPPSPPPNPANADYHFRYLNRLDPAEGLAAHAERAALPAAERHGTRRAPQRDRHGHDPLCRPLHRRHRVRQLGRSRRARHLPAEPADPRLAGGRADDGRRRPLRIRDPLHARYGWNGRGPIPGGATLLFTIELIAIPPQP